MLHHVALSLPEVPYLHQQKRLSPQPHQMEPLVQCLQLDGWWPVTLTSELAAEGGCFAAHLAT